MSTALLDNRAGSGARSSAGTPAKPPRRARRREWGLLIALLATAVGIRMLVIGRSLWLDETISVVQIDRPIGEVIGRQVDGVHPPLFHVLLHLWTSVFGTSEVALRLPSVLWSLVAIVAVRAWSREAFPDRSPWPAALLVALSPFAVWYGTEVRMYAQLLGLVAVSGWLAWSILNGRADRRRLLGLGIALSALAYTHYFATLFILGLGVTVVCIAVVRPDLRRPAIQIAALCVIAELVLAPWIAWTLTHRDAEQLTTVFANPDLFATLIASVEMLTGFRSYATLGVVVAAWPLLCLGALVLLPHLGAVGWRSGGLVTLVVLPPVALIVVSVVADRSAFDSRYLTVCAAPLYVLVGAGLNRFTTRRAWVPCVVALAVVAAGAVVWQDHDPSNPKLYELRQAVGDIDRTAVPGDAVAVLPQVNELGGEEPVLRYYKPPSTVRRVDTSPQGRAGVVTPSQLWERLRRTRPAHLYVLYGFQSLRYASAPGQVTTGRGVTARFDQYLSRRSLAVRDFKHVNVSVRVYRLNWRTPR